MNRGKGIRRRITIRCFLSCGFCFLFSAGFFSCDLYGQVGGADKTEPVYAGDPDFENIMASMSGVWYSRHAGIGRLDGYRIGKMRDFKTLMEDSGKVSRFPNIVTPYMTYTAESGSDVPGNDDYFVFYDDTVYGQADDEPGGGGGWQFSYMGIVRAVNVFNGNPSRGALITEYFKGCAPQWDHDIKDGGRPFFGIYYRVLDGGAMQIANAVDLAALYAGTKYYTETGTLKEAIAFYNAENEAEFISWGVVIPQDREAR